MKIGITVKVIPIIHVEHRGVEPLFRNLNRRDCPLGRSLVSVDLTSDEISATGGRQRFVLSNAFSAMSKSEMRTLRVRIKKSTTR